MVARRINTGGGHRYEDDGEPIPGVTSILRDGVPKPALVGWAANTAAEYAVNHWGELEQQSLLTRAKTIANARYETTKQAAARGTKVHEYAHQLMVGETIDVDEDVRALVDQCLAWLSDYDVVELRAEGTVINRRYGYMGSFDLLCGIGSEYWLIDYKTGGVYSEAALQLVAYARAEAVVDADGSEHVMPEVDRAGVLYLAADHYEFSEARIDDATFATFLVAKHMAEHANRDRDAYLRPMPAPERTEAAS